MCMPPVVRIRKVGVRVGQWLMPMCVAVLNAGLARNFMRMLVVLIVNVLMRVLHHLMHVFMLMPLRQMEPDSKPHQNAREREPERHWLTAGNREKRTKKRGY